MELTAVSSAVSLGDLRAESLYLLMMVIFFTVLAALVYRFLTCETTFRTEMRTAFGGKLALMRKARALWLVGVLWLLASGWFYNATFGARFFELEKHGNGPDVAWHLVYFHPKRTRVIPADAVADWTGAVELSRRTLKHALVMELKNGREFRSAGLHPELFKERAKTLRAMGIPIKTEPVQPTGRP